MARPKKYNLDTDQIKKLASLGCTNKEIGDFFGCSADLIEKSYSEFLTKGRAEQKLRLRQLQWKSAEKGNIVMQIWLGKQYLGQSENTIKEDDEPLAWSIE
tara:strand:+ start:410 stop:712 length:303 start_codon:yes stop_codon:yes gene_type:complete